MEVYERLTGASFADYLGGAMKVVVCASPASRGWSDPEGMTTARALRQLGFPVGEVHFGRTITVDVDAAEDDAVATESPRCAGRCWRTR